MSCRCFWCNKKHQCDSRYFVNLAALHSSCSIGAPHATKPSLAPETNMSSQELNTILRSIRRCSFFRAAIIDKRLSGRCVCLPLSVFRRRRAWWAAVPPSTTSTFSASVCYNIERCLWEIDRDQHSLSLSLSLSPPLSPSCARRDSASRAAAASVWRGLLTLSKASSGISAHFHVMWS